MAENKYYSHFLKLRLMEYLNDIQAPNASSVNPSTSEVNITQQQELALENVSEEIAPRGEQFIPIQIPEESDLNMEAIEDNLAETISYVEDNPKETTSLVKEDQEETPSYADDHTNEVASCSHLSIPEQGCGVTVKTENNNDSEESDDMNSEETNNNDVKKENPELNMLYSGLLKEPYEVFSPQQIKNIISKSFNMANIINDTERNRSSMELPSANLSEEDELKIKNKVGIKTLEAWRISRNNGIKKFAKLFAEEKEMKAKIEKVKALLVANNIEFEDEKFKILYCRQIKEEAIVEPINLSTRSPNQCLERQEQRENTNQIYPTSTSKPVKAVTYLNIADKLKCNEDNMVIIGPNGTMIAKTALQAINWSLSGAAVTRKILKEVFGREILAFHTLTGKASPAFVDCNKPKKNQLNPLKVADVTHFVMQHTTLTMKEVRNVITIKCADENKMFRQREQKRCAALNLQQTED